MSPKVFILFCMMITVSFLWPSEGAISGDGLQWVVCWLCLAALVAVRIRLPLDDTTPTSKRIAYAASTTVVLLIAGFWISTWHVFRVQGDRRAAVNLAFEWTAIGVVWWLIRCLSQQKHGRQAVTLLFVGLGVGTSVMGICQYHFTQPRQADWYQQNRQQIDQTLAGSDSAGVEILSQFKRLGIPLDGPGRELFERRLLGSSEPFGPFALGNTLGGVTAVVLILLTAGVWESLRATGPKRWASLCLSILCCSIVGYCLLLTKSRTAWVGVVVGFLLLCFQGGAQPFRVWFRRLFLLGLACGLVAAIGFGSGAIDKEVVLESLKSLQYRIFYLRGAAGVISESPIFGAGPGNFRQAYLSYKVPESSEEILDPHNILFDSWCSAGFVGLSAILLLIFGVLRRLRSQTGIPQHTSGAASFESTAQSKRLCLGILTGTALHVLWRWWNGTDWEIKFDDFFLSNNLVLVVPLAACVVVLTLSRIQLRRGACGAAFVCFVVHLLGAGGLQISICGLVLLALHSLAISEDGSVCVPRNCAVRWSWAAGFGFSAAAVIYWGFLPVTSVAQNLSLADFRASQGDNRGAEAALDQAILADSLSVESRQRKAHALTYAFLSNVNRYAHLDVPTDLQKNGLQADYLVAVESAGELINADRRSQAGYQLRGRVRNAYANQTGDLGLAAEAVKDLELVVAGYPSNSLLWCELAMLHQQHGESKRASNAARRALELEDINRSWGHADRFLSADSLTKLKRIVDSVRDPDSR